MNIRSQAISWWNSLTENSKIKFAKKHFTYRNKNNYHTMTGREIQIIFEKEQI